MGETTGATHVRSRDLRARIVETAWEMGCEGGPAHLTIRGIAERAGVSPSLIYQYFADKEGLVAELQRRAEPRLEAALADAMASAKHPRLVTLCSAYVEFAVAHWWLARPARDGAPAEATHCLEARFVRTTVEMLDAGEAARGSSEATALRILVAVRALVAAAAAPEDPGLDASSPDFVAGYLRMILRGI